MNDLEICKRIAEIVHSTAYIDCDDTGEFINLNHPMSDRGGEMYNPLAKTETGKALCFDLMVKHKVEVEWCGNECATWIDNEDGYPEYKVLQHDGTLQQAICLAIIEANEDK